MKVLIPKIDLRACCYDCPIFHFSGPGEYRDGGQARRIKGQRWVQTGEYYDKTTGYYVKDETNGNQPNPQIP